MIDWWNVITSSLWIAGLAGALAIFSHADWVTSTEGEGLRAAAKHTLQTPGLLLALALACLGAGLGALRPWQRALWLLLATGFAFLAFRLWFTRRKGPAG